MARDLSGMRRVAEQVEETLESPPESDRLPDVDWSRGVFSTGCTQLDLAIGGERVRGGGVPGGIMMEIYGPSGCGKTALMSEICGQAIARGGDWYVSDPEGRLDQEHARIYGVPIDHGRYDRPNTVPEVFGGISDWRPEPEKEGAICVRGVDSLAALSSQMEMSEEGDKRGQRRAKEFNEWTRKTCRKIANEGWLIVLTNQVRIGDYGEVTPGGPSIEYFSSIRVRIGHAKGWKVERTATVGVKEQTQIVGIRSSLYVQKNSTGIAYRSGEVFIMNGHGIDDVRGNLTYLKENGYKMMKQKGQKEPVPTAYSWYPCVDREVQSLDAAVAYVEEKSYQAQLRENVIDLWEEINSALRVERAPKVRG